jgi:putative peptidoglycan lipid II flippase
VIGVAIATGALPVMAAFAAKDAMGDMKEALQSSLRLAFFLTVPAIVGLALFRLPILHVLFERGAFTRPVTQLTADILLGYTVGLCFYVGNRILAPAFYAMHDTWTPVKTAMMAVGVNIAASIVLMRSMGASGLALATAIASAGNFLLLFIALRRRIGGLGARRILAAAARVVGACVPMAVWGVVSQAWWDILAVRGTASKISLLCVELAIAMAVFLVTAAWLGCDELAWARDLLRRRRESGSVSTF